MPPDRLPAYRTRTRAVGRGKLIRSSVSFYSGGVATRYVLPVLRNMMMPHFSIGLNIRLYRSSSVGSQCFECKTLAAAAVLSGAGLIYPLITSTIERHGQADGRTSDISPMHRRLPSTGLEACRIVDIGRPTI